MRRGYVLLETSCVFDLRAAGLCLRSMFREEYCTVIVDY